MRKKSIVLLFIIFLGILCTFDAEAAALEFVTEPFSDEEKAAFAENTGLELLAEDNYKGSILCFDVRQDGTYALAITSGPQNRIHVYDRTGAYLYGYKFSSEGTYGIQFCDTDSDSLAIYFTRSMVYAVYDSAGTCLDIQKVRHTDDNLSLAHEILKRSEKTLSGKNYKLERDMNIGMTYSRFVLTDEAGDRFVLYDNSGDHTFGQYLWIALTVGFLAFVVWGIVNKEKYAGT